MAVSGQEMKQRMGSVDHPNTDVAETLALADEAQNLVALTPQDSQEAFWI